MEEAVRDGEVEEPVAGSGGRLVQFRQMLAQPVVRPGVVQVALQIAHAVGEPPPSGLVDMVGLELAAALTDEVAHRIAQALAPIHRGLGGQVDADEPESIGEPLDPDEVVERRHHQTLGQIAGGAEDHHGAWRRGRNTIIIILRHVPGLGQLIPLGSHRRLGSHLCTLRPTGEAIAGPHRHLRPSSSLAAATTHSGSKPNLRCNSLSGAEAPKVFMPMTRPAAPT